MMPASKERCPVLLLRLSHCITYSKSSGMIGILKVTILGLVLSLGFLHALGLPLFGFKSFLGPIGLLGPLKIAVLAKAGFALGLTGTFLGIHAMENSQNQNENGYAYYYPQPDIEQGGPSYGSDSYDYKTKRSISDTIELEEALEEVKRSDPTQCTEKLLCHIASKSVVTEDEFVILALVRTKSVDKFSKAHDIFEAAVNRGSTNGDCESYYSTCDFTGENLVEAVRHLTSYLPKDSTMKILKL